jgi:hypothetical protein
MKVIFKKLEDIGNKQYDGDFSEFDLTSPMEYFFDGITKRDVYKEHDYFVFSDIINDKEWYIKKEWCNKVSEWNEIEKLFNIEL